MVLKYKEIYSVIYIDFELPSFKWCNGYYIVLGEIENNLQLCRLIDGQPELINGDYSISCTGKGNKGISKTNLTYTGEKRMNYYIEW